MAVKKKKKETKNKFEVRSEIASLSLREPD